MAGFFLFKYFKLLESFSDSFFRFFPDRTGIDKYQICHFNIPGRSEAGFQTI
jgi:hypothetical protein